ncbi:MAG: hypothetical protein GX220_00240 [Treponema sp.]|jgi:hypothetical protein|nr:hypothetical protein [Treponema sp.]
MILKKVLFSLVCVLLIFTFGCKSTPEPEPPVPVEEPKEEPVVEPVVEPGKADLSNENAQLVNQIANAKEKAISVGAKDAFATEFDYVSSAYDKAKKEYDAGGDQEVFNAKAKETLQLYQALELATYSKNMKASIETMDFAKYDEAKYTSGKANLDKVSKLFADKASGAEIFATAQASYNDMKAVYKAGYTAICDAKKVNIADVKKQADDIKASRGDKEGYAQALTLYEVANANFAAEKYEEAYKGYETTLVAFTGVYETVVEKRRLAEEAIARAKEKANKVHQYAQEADVIAPLPNKPEDEIIEAVDAVIKETEKVIDSEVDAK